MGGMGGRSRGGDGNMDEDEMVCSTVQLRVAANE